MKILFISLGCDKNLVDTEVMLGLLASRGYEMTDDETQADIIVINTCCFIHDAKEESIQNILEMAEYKKAGQAKPVRPKIFPFGKCLNALTRGAPLARCEVTRGNLRRG